MPASSRLIFLALLWLLAPALARAYNPPTEAAPRPFRYETDTFAFANETVWNYVDGEVKQESSSQKKREYTRHCFVLTRAAIQFFKFARFDPEARRLSDQQLADQIRGVTSRSVWLPALSYHERTVFPGYSSLRALSKASPGIFQANIGLGWPVYFRAGNFPITLPVSRATEARLHDEIAADLENNYPTVLWLYNFPSLNINHVVVIFAAHRTGSGARYEVYDPNYADGPRELDYDSGTRSFSYQPTFFFKGGAVTARAIYRGILQ